MKIEIIIYLLFVHWIADFIMQSDWMAQKKSKALGPLLMHCGIYGLCFSVLTLNPVLGGLLTLVHIPVDYATSRINSRLWADKKVHWFFVSVGFDQWIHFVTILLIYKLVS